MAYTQETTIWCDGVCCDWTQIACSRVNSARKEAAKSGWRVVNGKDYCPECVEKEVWKDA